MNKSAFTQRRRCCRASWRPRVGITYWGASRKSSSSRITMIVLFKRRDVAFRGSGRWLLITSCLRLKPKYRILENENAFSNPHVAFSHRSAAITLPSGIRAFPKELSFIDNVSTHCIRNASMSSSRAEPRHRHNNITIALRHVIFKPLQEHHRRRTIIASSPSSD